MRPDPVVEFCLGLGAIVLALAAALLLAFPPSWMDRREGAVATLADVSFLGEGSTVTRNGFVWGTVTAITPEGNHFRVHMKLQTGFAMAANEGLVLAQANPLQPAGLIVARQCRLVAGADVPSGCCPARLAGASGSATERGLASCGRLPNLVDQAQAIALLVRDRVAGLGPTIATIQDVTAKAAITLEATKATMTSALATSEKARGVLNDNGERLKSLLASSDATMASVKNTSKNLDELMAEKREQLDASITNLSSVLATTAATMPGVVDNLQKSAEDMRAITGQVRNEPTSLIRRRERADPSFVEPAPEK